MEKVTGFELIIAKSIEDFAAAEKLFREYAATLHFDLCFQKFDEELKELASQYGPPEGSLVLIQHNGNYVACAGIRRFEGETGELKRMYVQPAFRGKGLGKALLEKAIGLAVQIGYESIRLDTLMTMTPAICLYRQFGFEDIDAYRFNPGQDVLYLEKRLR